MKLSKTATAFTAIQLTSAVTPVVASADTISDVIDKAHKAGLDVKVEKSTAHAKSQAEADKLNSEQAKQLEKDAQIISTKIDDYLKVKQEVESYNKTVTSKTKTEGSIDPAKIQELKDQNAKIEKENAEAQADYLKRLAEVRAENEKKQRAYEEELNRIRSEEGKANEEYLADVARVRAENTKRISEYKTKLEEIRKEAAKVASKNSNNPVVSESVNKQLKEIDSAIEANNKALADYESKLTAAEAKNKEALAEYAKKKAAADSVNAGAQKDYEAALARYEADKAALDKRPVFAKSGQAEIRGEYNESARGSVGYFDKFGLLDPSYNGESLSEAITYKEGVSKISDVKGMTVTEGTFNGFSQPMKGVLFDNITNGASFTVSNVSKTSTGENVNMKVTIVDRGRSLYTATDGRFKAWLLHDDGAFGWEILDGDRLGVRYELYTESGKHLSVPTFNVINDIDYEQGAKFEFSNGTLLVKAPEGSGIAQGQDGIFWDVKNEKYSGWNSSPGGTLMAVGYGDVTYTHYSNAKAIQSNDTELKQMYDAIGRKSDDVAGYYYAIFGKSSLLKTAVPPKKPNLEPLPPKPELQVTPPVPPLTPVPQSPIQPDPEDPNKPPKKRPTLELLPEPPKPITDSTEPQPPTLVEEPKAPKPKSLNPIPSEDVKTVELKKDPEKPDLRLKSVNYVYTIKTIWETVDGHVLRPWKDGDQPKDNFTGYEYVRTVKDNDGNIHHIYKPIPKKSVTTIWVTEDGKVLRPRENGEQPKGEFDGYEYVRTEKDKDGNVKHIYKPVPKDKPTPKKSVTTIWVTEDGKVLRPRENGEQPKGEFDGYEYVRTEKDKDGNLRHIYKPVPKDKPTPKKSVTTIWVTEDGTVLRPRENGEQPKGEFDGYEYVRTEKDKDGNLRHIYKPAPKDKPTPNKSVTTIWTSEDGKVLRPRENGEQPKGEFDGYGYVRTEKDKDGNLRHIYKPVPKDKPISTKVPKQPQSKELPKTGDGASLGLMGAFTSLLGVFGLGRKKRTSKGARK